MKTRCYNPNFKAYQRYGGRGIVVCDEWKDDFPAFQAWATENGYSNGLTIDRIDNDRGYSPENCRWVDYKTQANNTRRNLVVTVHGETGTVAALCEKAGKNPFLIYDRITRLGWNAEKAFDTPKRKQEAKA